MSTKPMEIGYCGFTFSHGKQKGLKKKNCCVKENKTTYMNVLRVYYAGKEVMMWKDMSTFPMFVVIYLWMLLHNVCFGNTKMMVFCCCLRASEGRHCLLGRQLSYGFYNRLNLLWDIFNHFIFTHLYNIHFTLAFRIVKSFFLQGIHRRMRSIFVMRLCVRLLCIIFYFFFLSFFPSLLLSYLSFSPFSPSLFPSFILSLYLFLSLSECGIFGCLCMCRDLYGKKWN